MLTSVTLLPPSPPSWWTLGYNLQVTNLQCNVDFECWVEPFCYCCTLNIERSICARAIAGPSVCMSGQRKCLKRPASSSDLSAPEAAAQPANSEKVEDNASVQAPQHVEAKLTSNHYFFIIYFYSFVRKRKTAQTNTHARVPCPTHRRQSLPFSRKISSAYPIPPKGGRGKPPSETERGRLV